MKKQVIFISALGALLLSSCSSPSAFVPVATPEEVRAEQGRFATEVRNNPFPPIVEPVKITSDMKARLQRIANRINPEATKLCNELYQDIANKQCSFRLELSGKKGANAYADGEKVVVTSAMMVMAEDNNHLAFVLSHELAHNMMDHPSRVGMNTLGGSLLGTAVDIGAAAAGIGTGGAFGQLGGQASLLSYSPSFELEADYIGLYILERAGYQIEKAPDFWRAMAHYHPKNIYNSTTHPTNPERFVVMHKTINEIRSKQQLGFALLPEFKTQDHKKSGIF